MTGNPGFTFNIRVQVDFFPFHQLWKDLGIEDLFRRHHSSHKNLDILSISSSPRIQNHAPPMDFQQISGKKTCGGNHFDKGDDVWFHHVSSQRLPVIWWALPDSPCEISRSLEPYGAIAKGLPSAETPAMIPMFVFDTFRYCTPNGWKMLKDWMNRFDSTTKYQKLCWSKGECS